MIFVIILLLFLVSCNKKNLSDSIIQKIDAGKLNELTAEEKSYWDNVGLKADNGEKLTPDESRLYERLQKLTKELNPARFLPDKCFIGGNFNCLNFSVSKSDIQLVILQLSGYDLKNVKVSVNSCKKSSTVDFLKNGDKYTFLLQDCDNEDSGGFTQLPGQDPGKFNQDILIEYIKVDGSDTVSTSKGVLSSKIK